MMFKILDVCVSVDDNLIDDDKWKLFQFKVNSQQKFREAIEITYRNRLEIRGYWNLEYYDNLKKGDILVKLSNDIMVVNRSWNEGCILPINDKQNIYTFILQLFYAKVVDTNVIHFHSPLIEIKEKGILFLGPSGIGKTTQAELWNRYRSSKIINGDNVFVQETEDAFLGWGTPWHGSSPYCENTSVPVHAMIVLKQAPENSIRELTGFEKVSEVSNSVFYPRWLENGMELCLETLDHLLSKIPVYELSCRPDEDAVRLVEETVFK